MNTSKVPFAMAARDLPPRSHVRSGLDSLVRHDTIYALGMVAFDTIVLAGTMAWLVSADSAWLQLALAVFAGLMISRLFVLGHDACHQSLTSHRGLNRWVGRLMFLPSITPYSVWEMGHNIVHHTHANLKGFDPVWVPASPQEYRAMPAWRRGLERLYRSGWASGLYFVIEIWWKKMIGFDKSTVPSRRAVFRRDTAVVAVFAACWVAGLAVAAQSTGESVAWLLFVGFIVPQAVWFTVMGEVVYLHHTHPTSAWYDQRAEWVASHAYASTTVHTKFSRFTSTFFHHIMEHTAHHVDMRIPFYRLREAQQRIERDLPGVVIVQPFSLRWYLQATRICKLYDYEAGCWTDFDGKPTSPPTRPTSTTALAPH